MHNKPPDNSIYPRTLKQTEETYIRHIAIKFYSLKIIRL